MIVMWPAGAFFDARRYARMLSTEDPSRPFLDILRDMYALALKRNIPPLEYRLYCFYEPSRRSEMDQYLYWNDLPALAALNARRGANNDDVQDKRRFAEICARFDLPHVPTLAVFDHGNQITPECPFVPEHDRLFVKNLRGKGGQDAECWTRVGDDYSNSRNSVVPAASLARVLRRIDCVVQPRVQSHPALIALSNGALASLRIVTGVDRSGRAEFICALLLLPVGEHLSSVGESRAG